MTDEERCQEWLRYIRVTERHYEMNGLLTVLRNDGERMLLRVLKGLGLERSADLVKFAAKHDKRIWSDASRADVRSTLQSAGKRDDDLGALDGLEVGGEANPADGA
jgi:hypothetical protein